MSYDCFLQKHDEMLFRFLKNEFSEYKPKATFTSLQKYLKLISARTQFLIEEKVQQKSLADMVEGMKFMRNIYNLYHASASESLTELYRCDSPDRFSQRIQVPRTTVGSLLSYESMCSSNGSI